MLALHVLKLVIQHLGTLAGLARLELGLPQRVGHGLHLVQNFPELLLGLRGSVLALHVLGIELPNLALELLPLPLSLLLVAGHGLELVGDVRQLGLVLCLHLLGLGGLLFDLVQQVVKAVHVLAVLVSHVSHALLVVADGLLKSPLGVVELLLPGGPQLLLGGSHVKTVQELVLESLKFLVKVSLLFLSLVPGLLFSIEILRDLAELTLKFPESLLCLGLD